ncbi:helix-turn-helix domain-containing protein [Microbacterium flavum]|uniref:helix-turn-helix domain-containing protein n=1 Tax=Microbacterium flavum TaxID=415216 RepID=UPI0024AE3B1B|nr:AraC family transcriptional regulator [Microbacterium flavum]
MHSLTRFEVNSYTPIVVRTRTDHLAIAPIAFDCVKLIVVRAGGALLSGEFGNRNVEVGDVIVLAANTLCGAEPEDWITATTLYIDRDYVIDQVFWQHAAQFRDRRDAVDFLDTHYSQPAQVIRIGEDRAGILMPWLDELAALSTDGAPPHRFHRMQALLFAVLDVVLPLLAVSNAGRKPIQRTTTLPTRPRHRQFRPLRPEAREAAGMMRSKLHHRWTVSEIADSTYLSTSQLRRVFVEAFGKSPIAYLTMLRVERMAELLSTTNWPISRIAAEVGWGDADFAARQFRRSTGVPPTEYRRIGRRSILVTHPE